LIEESDIVTTGRTPASAGAPQARRPASSLSTQRARKGDSAFRGFATGSGMLILVVMAAIAVFLVLEAIPAFTKDKGNFFSTFTWDPDGSQVFGIGAIAFGSVLSSALALIIGVPVAVGVALFISQYASRVVARPLAYIVDLLAAVPSVIYGLWGVIFLVPHMVPLSAFLNRYLSWIPLFSSPQNIFGKSVLSASVVLAVMMLPIVAALSREVFVQTPREHQEGAVALGATKWETIRLTVLPYGKSGVISAIVLGFGRAIGETIAVALVLSSNYGVSWHILVPGGNTIAANIANRWGDAGDIGRPALIASGLVLFIITLVVNYGARAIVRRGTKKAAA
jgi:phosphate transport system permease protein